jgi:EpsI family protein
MNNKHFIIVVLILTVAIIVGYIFYSPLRHSKATGIKMNYFPMSIGEWRSEDTPLPERVYDLLGTKNLIIRDYKNERGDAVNLYIVYSQDNRKVSLPPEVDLQDEDTTITDQAPLKITDLIHVTMLMIQKDASSEAVAYWYRAGGVNTNIYLKQQLKVVIDRMLGKKTSVALIRVSTKIEDNKEGAALNRLKAFCVLIEPLLDKYFP